MGVAVTKEKLNDQNKLSRVITGPFGGGPHHPLMFSHSLSFTYYSVSGIRSVMSSSHLLAPMALTLDVSSSSSGNHNSCVTGIMQQMCDRIPDPSSSLASTSIGSSWDQQGEGSAVRGMLGLVSQSGLGRPCSWSAVALAG